MFNNPIEDSELQGVSGETPDVEEGIVESEGDSTTPGKESVDAGEDLRAEFEAMQQKYERDIAAMKSSLQASAQQTEKEWKRRYGELESAYHQLNMRDMTEPERATYERNFYAQKYDELNKESAQLREQLTENQSFGEAVTAFSKMGIGTDRLDLRNGLKGVVESGWAAVGEDLIKYRGEATKKPSKAEASSENSEGASTSSKQAPGSKRPPKTAGKQGSSAGGKTWGDTISAAEKLLGRKDLSEEDVWRAVENGELDPKIIPGL